MKSICTIYYVYFMDVPNIIVVVGGESLEGKVYIVLASPSSNVSSKQNLDRYSPGCYTLEDIRDLIELDNRGMVVKEHGHVFCFWMKFPGGYK